MTRIVAVLEADVRVDAAWLSGSFGRGEADEWADLDLHVAIADTSFDAFIGERPELYPRVGRPILIQQEMASNSVNNGRFQLVWYEGPFEVDWNIGPTSAAARWPASQMLLERVPIPSAT
ncbi:MAG: hypothetical protein ACYDCQ_12545, partial [Dehalococcoidia bacterium]